VSRYQKGKTHLDFTEARDSEWQWHQLGHMQVCTSFQTDNYTSIPPLMFFTGWMPFLLPNQQHQSSEGKAHSLNLLLLLASCIIYVQIPAKMYHTKINCFYHHTLEFNDLMMCCSALITTNQYVCCIPLFFFIYFKQVNIAMYCIYAYSILHFKRSVAY